MVTKITAFKDRKGGIHETEREALIVNTKHDLLDTGKRLDFIKNDFDMVDLSTYNLNELVRLGRMASEILK